MVKLNHRENPPFLYFYVSRETLETCENNHMILSVQKVNYNVSRETSAENDFEKYFNF